MHAINLIPARRRRAKAQRRGVLRWATGLGFYALLVLMALIWQASRSGVTSAALADEANRLAARAVQSQQLLQAVHVELAGEQRRLAAVQAVGRQPDWSLLLSLLSATVGEHLVLDSCRLVSVKTSAPDATGASEPPCLVELTGSAESQAALSAFVLRLEKARLFDATRLIKSQLQPAGNRTLVAFRLECWIGRSGDEALDAQ